MDWRYKRVVGARTYAQSADEVLAAARGLLTAMPPAKWAIEDVLDGFKVTGIDFGHPASAVFRVARTEAGTRLSVELDVRRWGLEGFMLFDLGGYFSGELDRWLEAIGDQLEGRVGAAAPHRPRSLRYRLFTWIIVFAVIVGGLLFLWTFAVGPVVALITGAFYLPGRNGDVTLHGASARGLAVAILALDVLFYFNWRRLNRGPQRLVGPQ